MSTAAAISTPLAEGGISVIRISGERAIEIADKVFSPVSSDRRVCEMNGYTCAYGKVVSHGEYIDDAVLTVFREPRSYTGEDTAEISCHGGVFIAKKVLRAVLSEGAVPAEAGEFTKRAFLNGKLLLTEAEAVMDLISSNGEQSHRAALSAKDGALYRRISAVSGRLIKLLGELSAWVDYPEEDLPEIDNGALSDTLSECLSELSSLSLTYDSGRILRNGIDTVLVGKANVGKSTLMNVLLGFERSIVTDIEGTTRDIVEENVKLGDVILRLSDTAGIRDTEDEVESIGVSRSLKKISEADLIIALFDNSSSLTSEDESLIEKIADKNVIAVVNKTDKPQLIDLDYIGEKLGEPVLISAKTTDGIDKLQDRIERIFHMSGLDLSAGFIANERQKRCVERAISSLSDALNAFSFGETLDAVTILIDEAEQALLELSGEKITEAVVDEVFSHFCVGK